MNAEVAMKMAGDNIHSKEMLRPWVWPAILLCGVFWILYYGAAQLGWDLGSLFFFRLGICGVLLLSGMVFWWTNTRIPLIDRALIAVLFVVALVITSALSDKSIGGFGMYLFGIPVVYSIGAIALVATQFSERHTRRNALALAIVAAFGIFMMIRMDGVDGNAGATYSLRWAKTAEEKFLANRQAAPVAPVEEEAVQPVTAQPGDWPEFRGAARDGVTHSGEIRTDWSNPPPLLWKKLVGPAWSSVIVVDGKLFTQEQRGKVEAVVCYDAQTGAELWAAEYGDRYWDSVSGAGPRATPTFANGRIYAFGAQGELLAVDAASGKIAWTKKTRDESKADVQMWGFSSSPLVTGCVVIAFAGGEKGKSLLALKVEDGKLAWTADAGKGTYCSPEVVTLGDQKVVIATSELGLLGFDPTTGERLFKAGSEMPNHPHALQPHALPSADQPATQFLVATS